MQVSIAKPIRGLALCAGVLTGAVIFSLAPAVAGQPEKAPITEDEVKATQQAWCDALVEIGSVYQNHGDYKAVASRRIDELYDYTEGTVFFKPTLTFGTNTFRPTKEGALSYFVGGSEDFPEDKGFALKPWKSVRYENNAARNGIQIHGDIAIAMGNVYLIDPAGKETKVDQTFVFRKGRDGRLRLCAHHSSLPIELFCCLDEWQGGSVCPAGQRLASQCGGSGCTNCGTFTCVPESALCLQQQARPQP
jgi:hypothetical protein